MIRKPVDMVKIQQKIMTQQYSNLEEMGTDCAQMFENAYKYNDPDSLIYKVKPARSIENVVFNEEMLNEFVFSFRTP